MKDGKSVKFNLEQQQQQQQQANGGHLSPFKFPKLLDPDASCDKDQLGDVFHWIRQVVALVCGLLWGAFPLVGGIWIVVFLLISSAIIYGYYSMVLKIDEEDFGGHGTLLQEGLFASITLFLVLRRPFSCFPFLLSLKSYTAWRTSDLFAIATLALAISSERLS